MPYDRHMLTLARFILTQALSHEANRHRRRTVQQPCPISLLGLAARPSAAPSTLAAAPPVAISVMTSPSRSPRAYSLNRRHHLSPFLFAFATVSDHHATSPPAIVRCRLTPFLLNFATVNDDHRTASP
ncbi:hypothetical protein E2562_000630 [Oryza meyeriana var. granulata]|uniref:Uncharacterized protein n=1 Tax=Oryza meyeriana var. granulata TaxID=110450 RepID=A0A6G1DTZ7_9ORYZ|nr:hypothetical protein E2562_000630 [Oryza meyeriana var. granulata]